ncbi:hypothetical protein SOPP22_08440 [Shewanella sp. OPT22]|nr:hypothetical protein SOPP22_08440 [Shewanella sp. OPT22]
MIPSRAFIPAFATEYDDFSDQGALCGNKTEPETEKPVHDDFELTKLVYNENIPSIIIDAPESESEITQVTPSLIPAKLGQFERLQVELPDVRDKLVEDTESERNQAITEAEEAKEALDQAVIKMAKKTFFTKLAKSFIAIGALALAIGLAVPTGGVSIAAAAIFGIAAVSCVSDTIFAAVDWGLKAKGKEGLPMESDAVANIAYALFRAFKVSEATSEKCAGWTSVGIKTGLTLGLLWADSVTPKSKIKPKTILDNSKKLLDVAGKKLDKYAESINMTKEKLRKLEEESELKDVYKEGLNEDSQDISEYDTRQDATEEEIQNKLRQKRVADFRQIKTLKEQLSQERTELATLSEAIRKVAVGNKDNSAKAELSELLKATTSSSVVLMSNEERVKTSNSSHIFCASQVPLPSEIDYSLEAKNELDEALSAIKKAKKNLREAKLNLKKHNAVEKVLKSVFSIIGVGGAVAATVLTGPLAVPLLVFAVGSAVNSVFDAGVAVYDYKRVKSGKNPLPIKDNGMANVIFCLLHYQFKVNEDKAISIAKKVAGGIKLVTTLGGKWPEKDEEFSKKLEEAEKYLEPISENIAEKLREDAEENVEAAELDKDVQELKKKLAEEQIYRMQIANEFHREQKMRIRKAHRVQKEALDVEKKGLRMSLAETKHLLLTMNELLSQLPEELKDRIKSFEGIELPDDLNQPITRALTHRVGMVSG